MTRENPESLLEEDYWHCVETCQRMGAELAELEDYLYDELGLNGDELIDCVKELVKFNWIV